ncbi:uncharacterized protein DUF3180 [Labedella gwakjiensis]|uniref:DUF3180 domain-containing protein n=1 Tax=Labedella gwakjiensis TaxID=390269 RepID=A0A2P8GSC0_9MICO|nr:DUF3180 domain-containing protein [Labedella gwakjiensis]PSL36857.1 uncharacterized protein DUF3180 [Labedella gwakjiensis]RUQ84358.1 DUF3180 domain-containing protein [Labedella gwakjiensis]
MTRTTPGPLFFLALGGFIVGFLLDLWTASRGAATIVPPLSFSLTLVVVGAIVVGFAVPIHRRVRGRSDRSIDPFQATRVVSLAKASSLAGALLSGFGLGILAFLLSRSTLPGIASLWLAVAATVGAVVLTVAGLVAERLCTLPKDDDDEPPAGAPAS